MLSRIKGFTIVEIVLAMLLSSIVIFMAYTTYMQMEKYILKRISDKQNNTEMLFRTVLKRDFMEADKVISIDSGMLITADTMRIKYLFEDNLIQRVTSSIDTFRLDTKDISFWNDSVLLLERDKVIDRLTLSLIVNNEVIHVIERRIAASNEYY